MTSKCGKIDALSKVLFKKPLEPLNVDPSEYAQSMQAMLLLLKNRAVKMENQLCDETSVRKSVAQEEELEEDHLPLVEGPDDIVIGSDEEMESEQHGVISPLVYGEVVGARTGGDRVEVSTEKDGGSTCPVVSGGVEHGGDSEEVLSEKAASSVCRRVSVVDSAGVKDGVRTGGDRVEVSTEKDGGSTCPVVSGGVEHDGDSEEVLSEKAASSVYPKVSVVDSAGDKHTATASVATAVRKAGGKDKAQGKDSDSEQSDPEEVQTYQGKSHNKRRKCPLCDYIGVHLKRHLTCKHPDGVQSAAERARIVYQADQDAKQKRGLKTTVTNPDKRLYQCGLPDC